MSVGNMLHPGRRDTSIGRQFVTTSSTPEHQDANSIRVSEIEGQLKSKSLAGHQNE